MTTAPNPNQTQHGDDAGADGVVLYVEDNAVNVRLMEAVFRSRPTLTLLSATTAEAGLDLVREHPVDLVLMDINLPGMNGYDALAALRGDPETAGVVVVAVTSDAMLGDAEAGLDAGFDDYITKPIDVVGFYALLDRYLGRAGGGAEG